MNAIEIRALTKRFGNITAVHPLTLDIPEGETFGLLGVNGAGKTTTIRMLSCLLRPDGGDARLLGQSILGDTYKIKEKINVSWQETAIAPMLSVEENLALMADIYSGSGRRTREDVQQMLRDFGLEEMRKQRAKTLSGGWQRRLSIAMALVSEPKILFLDEPTLGLDVLARRELWKNLSAWRGKITIVLTTHYLEEAAALCDRIGIMIHGKMKALGTTAELCAETGTANLEEAFVRIAGEEDTTNEK